MTYHPPGPPKCANCEDEPQMEGIFCSMQCEKAYRRKLIKTYRQKQYKFNK